MQFKYLLDQSNDFIDNNEKKNDDKGFIEEKYERLYLCVSDFITCLSEKVGRQRHVKLDKFLSASAESVGWKEYEVLQCRNILISL